MVLCVLPVWWKQFSRQSLSFHQPGTGKHSAVAGIAKKCNKACYRCLKLVRCFWLFLIGLLFRFQVLGTKYKHELLVDHPFSDITGSCGNLQFLPFILCLLFEHYALLFVSISKLNILK